MNDHEAVWRVIKDGEVTGSAPVLAQLRPRVAAARRPQATADGALPTAIPLEDLNFFSALKCTLDIMLRELKRKNALYPCGPMTEAYVRLGDREPTPTRTPTA